MTGYKKRTSYSPSDWVIICILCIAGFLSLVPIMNTLAISLSNSSAAEGDFVFLLPVGFNLSSYNKVIQDPLFYKSVLVSIKRVLAGTSINMFLTILMGFALSRSTRKFRARNIYTWIMLFTMMFSGGLIPNYIMVTKYYGLQDTLWALILPCAVSQFNVILLMNFFRNLPKEMDESALVDGAGPWRILFSIYLPLAKPALATILLFSLLSHWNAFFDGLIYMNKSDNYPLATYIQQVVVSRNFQKMTREEMMNSMQMSNRTLNAAKVFLSLLPVLCIYPFVQKYFIHGIMLGAVKG